MNTYMLREHIIWAYKNVLMQQLGTGVTECDDVLGYLATEFGLLEYKVLGRAGSWIMLDHPATEEEKGQMWELLPDGSVSVCK